jgi:tetratricopeptide (TPR) repeat protein
MPGTARPKRPRKQEREHLRAAWAEQGLDVDEIAGRFRALYREGALVCYRWACGMVQEQVADEYNAVFPDARPISLHAVSEWERWPHGGAEPSVTVLQRLAVVFGTTPARLAAALFGEDTAAQDARYASLTSASNGPDERRLQLGLSSVAGAQSREGIGTLEGTVLRRWDELMRRRSLLAYAGATAAAVLIPTLPAAGSSLPTGSEGAEVCDRLAALTATYRQLDGLLGPTAVYGQAIDHHRRLTGWLDRTPGEPQWPQVARVTIDASILLAWLHFDLERYADAAELYRQAVDIARALDDVDLQAFLVGRMSRTLSECGQHTEALAFARAAAEVAGTAATPVVRSWLAVTRAYVSACLGDERSCRADLAQAQALLDRADGQPPGPYIAFYGQPYLYKWTGHALLRLAEHQDVALAEGRSVIDHALSAWSGADVRESGEVLAACARVRLAQREIDEAARLTGRAYDIAAATSSLRVLRYVTELRGQLTFFRDTPAVRALDERMLTSR